MTPTPSGQPLRLPPAPSSGRRRGSPRDVEPSSLSGPFPPPASRWWSGSVSPPAEAFGDPVNQLQPKPSL